MLRCETLFLKVIPTMTARSHGEPLPKMYSNKLASLMALALNRQKKYKKKKCYPTNFTTTSGRKKMECNTLWLNLLPEQQPRYDILKFRKGDMLDIELGYVITQQKLHQIYT